MSDINPIPPVVDGDNSGVIGEGISLARAVITSVICFVCLMVFPLLVFFVVPKFKVIFADMLGPGEGLPEFTVLTLRITDFLQNNAMVTLPAFLLFAFICAGFLGFQKMFLPPKICRSLSALFGVVWLGIIAAVILAMFLPLIKMMDKLGN